MGYAGTAPQFGVRVRVRVEDPSDDTPSLTPLNTYMQDRLVGHAGSGGDSEDWI